MEIKITRIEADLIIAGLHDLEVKVPESKSSFLLAHYEKIEPLYKAIDEIQHRELKELQQKRMK
tara:strand:- start:18 stop:209 length:192 start_codon:yes stop_codon:yes gene_type:complete